MCAKEPDPHGDHRARCVVGPYINGAHAEASDILATAGREAGFTAFRESCIPEMQQTDTSGNTIDAIMDVELQQHHYAHGLLLDISIRHATADSVVSKAADVDGHAAALAVVQKAKRYPGADGRTVTPCVIETFGRTENHLDQTLCLLDGLAKKQEQRRGATHTQWRRKWALHLQLSVTRSVARAILAEVGVHVAPSTAGRNP